jgi:O-acetyl-ADP-ribose deacetylase (regulator of RNase III)
VIHAVGPVYSGGKHGEAALLASAYRSSLNLASQDGIKSLAFPSLSTGAYGYPLEEAASVALNTAIEYLKEHPEIDLVRFVLFGQAAHETYQMVLERICQERGLSARE